MDGSEILANFAKEKKQLSMKFAIAVLLFFVTQSSFSQPSRAEEPKTSHLSAENIKYYPNPSLGIASIEFPTLPNELELEVINAKGELVRLEYMPAGSKRFVLSNLETGVYILRIQDVTVQWQEKLFVHQK
jgi:hypothetical protein